MAITTPTTDSASSGAQGAAKLIKERLPLTRLNFILMGAAILVRTRDSGRFSAHDR